MTGLLASCAASVVIYLLAFGMVLDRPLSLGMFRAQIEAKLDRGAAIEGPKLVVLAGSNGPFSHRCEVIGQMLAIDCVNAGIAVGIGLDYLFARWRPLLRPGDSVYLPLEEAQYTRSRAVNALGPDASIMFRRDRATLAALPPDRWAGAAFSFGPRAVLMSAIETALVWSGFHDPRDTALESINAWGDRIGHTPVLGLANAARLAKMTPYHETAAAIATGNGTAIVRDFIAWASAHGVRVVGGLPAEFAASPVPEETRTAIRDVFVSSGARFLDPPEREGYPPSAFFDTPDHLNEVAQIAHSRAIAAALAPILAPARAASR